MSIPAETPAAVTTSPLSTKRSSGRTSIVGSIWLSESSEPQWVVAGRSFSTPAVAKTWAPVQTLVIKAPLSRVRRTQSSTGSFSSNPPTRPPGNTSTSSGGASSHVRSAKTRRPCEQVTGSAVCAIVKTDS